MDGQSSQSDAQVDATARTKDHFLALPNELFEVVLTHLDLPSIQRLRLTSTQYADKCLCPAFKQYYSHQETNLTPASLQRLFQLTTHPILGPAVSDLNVVSVFYDPSFCIATVRSLRRPVSLSSLLPASTTLPSERAQQLLEGTERLSWLMSKRQEQQGQFIDDLVASLAHVFENMGSLESLRLTARVVRERSKRDEYAPPGRMNWNSLWADCHRVLRIVTLAMAKSKANIGTFSIFNQTFGKVQSRAFGEVALDLLSQGFSAATGANVRNLNLSFSTATVVPGSDIFFMPDGSMEHRGARRFPMDSFAARSPVDFPGIAEFLRQTPNLEGLDLYMYNTLGGAPWPYDKVFVHIAKDVRLPKLKRLTLRGIRTTQEALLLFLQAHPNIMELDFREVHISGGTWSPILKHFESMHKLSKMHLENLWSGSKHLLNLQPSNPLFQDVTGAYEGSYRTKNGVMVHTRDITMEELRQEGGLSFVNKPGRSRAKGSRALMVWMKERREAYGPPQ